MHTFDSLNVPYAYFNRLYQESKLELHNFRFYFRVTLGMRSRSWFYVFMVIFQGVRQISGA